MGSQSPGDPDPNNDDMIGNINSYLSKEQNDILNHPYRLSPIHVNTLNDLEGNLIKMAETFKGDEENLKQIKGMYYKVKQLQKKKISYNEKDKGPFVVMVENTNNTGSSLHPMDLGKKLFSWGVQVKNISKKGFNKVGITCHNFMEANNFLFNPQLNANGIISYIPQNFLTCKGIIKNVSSSINEEDLIQYAVSTSKIIEARRLNRKLVEGKSISYVPSNTILLTFDGKKKPDEISIFACFAKVHPYIQPLNECHNCLRFGHSMRVCKSKTRCSNCGDSHNNDSCSNATKCVFCHEEHQAFYKECKEYNRQSKLRELMTFHELSYLEAAKLCPPLIKNPSKDNFTRNPQSFPILTQSPHNNVTTLPATHVTHSPYQNTQSQAVKRRKHILIEKPSISNIEFKNATFPDPSRRASPNGVALTQDANVSNKNTQYYSPPSYSSVVSSPSPNYSPITPMGGQTLDPAKHGMQPLNKFSIKNTIPSFSHTSSSKDSLEEERS